MQRNFRKFRFFVAINASIMPENQDHPIFKEYEKRRNSDRLSPNLHNPTPASLRDECLIVYQEKGKPKEDVTLRAFFGAINTNEDYDSRISNFDIDKFRPLSYFLKGTSKSTNKVNVDLLKWLINDEDVFLPEQSETLPGSKPWYRRAVNFLKENAGITLTLLSILLIGKLAFYLWTIQISNVRMPDQAEKCMYWTGYHYEPVSCDEIKPGLNIIPLNIDKLKRMSKIPFFVKVTNRDVGKLWRAKIDG
ncbi:MAG: hypothetical protein EOO90_31655, partial [Pedobacter sp.]